MDGLRAGNLGLAFGLELAMLAGFAMGGWSVAGALWLRVALAVGLPAIAIVLWWLWAAPRGARRLKMPALAVFKAVILSLGGVAFAAAGQGFVAAVYGVLLVVNFLGMWAFGQW